MNFWTPVLNWRSFSFNFSKDTSSRAFLIESLSFSFSQLSTGPSCTSTSLAPSLITAQHVSGSGSLTASPSGL